MPVCILAEPEQSITMDRRRPAMPPDHPGTTRSGPRIGKLATISGCRRLGERAPSRAVHLTPSREVHDDSGAPDLVALPVVRMDLPAALDWSPLPLPPLTNDPAPANGGGPAPHASHFGRDQRRSPRGGRESRSRDTT